MDNLFRKHFMDGSYDQTEVSHKIDSEIIKTHYARDCNDKIVSFVIQEDPNLLLDFSSICIGFSLDVPKDQLPENGMACKQFKNMTIELDSQLITSTKSL